MNLLCKNYLNRLHCFGLFSLFLLACSLAAATKVDELGIPHKVPLTQGQLDGSLDVKGNFHQEFHNGTSYHHHHYYYAKGSLDEESLETASVTVSEISEIDVSLPKKESPEERQKRLKNSIRKQKKSPTVHTGESSYIDSRSTSSGVTIAFSIKKASGGKEDEEK
jgi:hypothetical protein